MKTETLVLERHAPRTAFLVTGTGNRLLEIHPASAEGGVDFEGRMERITRAVNAHDALVAALRDVLRDTRGVWDVLHQQHDPLAGELERAMDAARVVLAKAEGREP